MELHSSYISTGLYVKQTYMTCVKVEGEGRKLSLSLPGWQEQRALQKLSTWFLASHTKRTF